MATVYLTEFAAQGRDAAGNIVQGTPCYPSAAEQTVAISGTSTASAAFNASTAIIVLTSDVACSVAIGAAPVATTTSRRIAANVPMQIGVRPGAGYKLAVIANT